MMRLPVTNLPASVTAAPTQRASDNVGRATAAVDTQKRLPTLRRPKGRVARRSFYVSLLRLKRIRPTGAQRLLLIEGSVTLGVIAALADIVSAWIILILPVAVAAAVKFEDMVATALAKGREPAHRRPARS